ncbi:kinase-like protein [Macrolepiota fuliginosa MF-IS2]|uniref:Kinase-like protein n=1 Tax=Macrolepiota fuliginosa MF-IS2 TaxID=1400762 RepID=A0A9P5X4H9_9AGAR|nr:kinase-like protein [Macrolepiota fuliginosa MF-IS2]
MIHSPQLLGQAGFEDPGVRKLVLQSLCRLSTATMRYPQRYALEGIDNIVARGGGGFCDIYQARHGERDLCLKAVRLFQASSKEIAFGLYSEEASLWGQLRHPNIVPFYGIFHLKDLGSQQICLVSPWMEKGTVIQYLEANLNTIQHKLYDIACGLQYLHEKRIVHADLKGDNILINDSGRACITDFGLSTIWNEMTVENMSVSDVRGQTWRYCSPELVNDAAPSPVNDIWAFGMVCYEIMTRKRPYYESKTDRQIIMRITKGDLPTRPTGNESDIDQIDDVTWDLMQSCWAKESKERPTCEQILRRPELAGFAKEGEGDYVDYKTEEKWQFHNATPSGAAAGAIDPARIKEILNELK